MVMVFIMIYVLYGLEDFLIEKEINKILKDAHIEEINVSHYDMETDDLKDVIEDASMTSLFALNKGIICENAFFLTGSTKKGTKEQDTTLLENYAQNINPDTLLIFTVQSEKLDERKKITKTLKNKAILKSYNKNENNLKEVIKPYLEDYQMSSSDLDFLIARVGKDLYLLEKEIEKLKLYAYDSKKITKEDILALTSKNIDLDIFGLIEHIVTKNKERAMETYHEMLKRNEEPIKIIVMLANQFRLIYQAKSLYQKGYTENNIASALEVHPYRIKLALQKGRNFKDELLLSYLNQLADLDANIKLGNIEKELGLELFILGL